jgi:hypothetical protein
MNHIAAVTVVFEFLATGGVEPYIDVNSMRAVRYARASDWVQLVLEILCFLYILGEFLCREILEV